MVASEASAGLGPVMADTIFMEKGDVLQGECSWTTLGLIEHEYIVVEGMHTCMAKLICDK